MFNGGGGSVVSAKGLGDVNQREGRGRVFLVQPTATGGLHQAMNIQVSNI
jgi:hypothetical protein